MKLIKDYWFIILIVFLFGGNLVQYFNPMVKIERETIRDTVTTVITDSVSLTRAKAELNYLRAELNKEKVKNSYLSGKTVTNQGYWGKIDTIIVSNTEFIVPNFVASLDTTVNQSKLSLNYHYPQNYFSDILFTFPQKSQTITKTVTEKPLFDFSHGILVGGFVGQDGVIRLGVGYGFKIGLNL